MIFKIHMGTMLFLLLSLMTFSPFQGVAADNFWNPDTFITTTADLLEHSDLLVRESRDPLLREIEAAARHQHDKNTERAHQNEFLIPLLSDSVGLNNQLMEYMTAAVVARSTGRTLCLAPFFIGPRRHAEIKSHYQNSLAIEDHYDIKYLSQFVNVIALDRCMRVCSRKLNLLLFLRGVRQPNNQKWSQNATSKDLGWSFVNWTSTSDIARDLSFLSKEQCIGLGGLFPGLRWRGAYLASTKYIHPTTSILNAANALQEKAIGNQAFLAVHWRFEESNCQGHRLGLCFIRCRDGSIVDSGFHPAARDWIIKTKYRCPNRLRGVVLAVEDIVNAIYYRAAKDNLRIVYLATDGWMRGKEAQDLLKEVVNNLRNSGLEVLGLWEIEGLPNLSNGSYFNFSQLHTKGRKSLSLIEQELCFRATTFLGSGQSTWSLTVFRSRLAKRRSEEIMKGWKEKQQAEIEFDNTNDKMIESLLEDKHAAGMQCRYEAFFNRVKITATAETSQDEEPDGWLDMEACEKRIGRGGRCEVAACF